MSETAVTALVYDARPAQQGARDFEAAAQRILGANSRVAEATQRVTDSSSRMERALAALQRQTDPAGAAQERLARGQTLLQQALDRGRLSADEYSRRLELLNQRYAQVAAGAAGASAAAARQATGFAAANDNVSSSSGRMRQALGQAGFQIQDFVSQVGAGQNALLAFGQQAGQLAGAFGPTGAIVGAVLTIGAIAAMLLTVGDNAGVAQQRAQAAMEAMQRDAQETARVIAEIGDLFLTAAERAQRLASAQRENLRIASELQLSNAVQRQDSALVALPALEAQIAQLERQAAVEARLREASDRAARAATPIPGQRLLMQDDSGGVAAQLFTLRAQRDGLQIEIARAQDAIRQLNEQRDRLARAGGDQGYGQYGPFLPGGRAGAGRAAAVERVSEAERILNQQIAEGVRLAERAADASEVYARQVTSLELALAAGRITQDDYNRAVRDLDPAVQAARRAADEAAEAQRRFEQSSIEAFARIGESALERIGQGLVNAFVAGQGAAVNFGNITRGIVASLASELLKLALINPLSNAVLGTTRPTLGGALGGQGGFSLGGLGRALDFSNIGQLGGLTGTLFGRANTGVYAATGVPGVYGPVADPGLLGANGTLFGLPAASAIGGALGIGGGAFGVAAGIRQGGIGGAFTTAGGIAGIGAGLGALGIAGMAALAPILGPLALALPLIGAFLPGQQPSSREQGAFAAFGGGGITAAGLGGARFSAANAAQASGFVGSILEREAAIASVLGFNAQGNVFATIAGGRGRGPGTIGLAIGNSGLRTFANDEAGQRAAAEASVALLFDAFRDAARQRTDDMARIVQNSPTFQALQENLLWFQTTYQQLSGAFEAAVPRTSQFASALMQLQRPFEEAANRARALGLSVEGLARNQARAVGEALDAALRDAQGRGFLNQVQQLVVDRGLADFETRNQRTGQIFDIAGAQFFRLFEQLDLAQLADVIANTADEQARLIAEAVTAQRRAAEASERAAQAQQRAAGIRDFVLTQRSTSGPGGPSPAQALQELQRQFGAQLGLARQGDVDALSGIAGTAQRLLDGGASVFGSSQTFQALRNFTLESLSNLPGVGLGGEATTALGPIIQAGDRAVVNELQALRADNARQADEIRQMRLAIERLERNASAPVGTRAA